MSNQRVLVKTKGGMNVWIPKDRLAAWQKADHEAPVTEEERAKLKAWKEQYLASRSSTKE